MWPLESESLAAVLFENDSPHNREEFDQGPRRPLSSVHFCQALAILPKDVPARSKCRPLRTRGTAALIQEALVIVCTLQRHISM
jgi:hypothetical protein